MLGIKRILLPASWGLNREKNNNTLEFTQNKRCYRRERLGQQRKPGRGGSMGKDAEGRTQRTEYNRDVRHTSRLTFPAYDENAKI